MKVAKAKGRLLGKQPKLSRRQDAHLVSLVHSGEYSTAEVAELVGVGRSTVYRATTGDAAKPEPGLPRPRPDADIHHQVPDVPHPIPLGGTCGLRTCWCTV
jgi:hypothetical protein